MRRGNRCAARNGASTLAVPQGVRGNVRLLLDVDTVLGIPFMAVTISNIIQNYSNAVRALNSLSLTIGNNNMLTLPN